MNFEKALEELKNGKCLYRKGWYGKHYIKLQTPTEKSKMTLPYIYMVVNGLTLEQMENVPWVASHSDLLAEDWEIIFD